MLSVLISTLPLRHFNYYNKSDRGFSNNMNRNKEKITAQKKDDDVFELIGSGEHSMVVKAKKGQKIFINSGDQSFFVKAGVTPEEDMKRVDDYFDAKLYSNQVTRVRKLIRRLKNK